MSEQLDINWHAAPGADDLRGEAQEVARRRARERSLDHRFAEFHRANPGVYAELVRLARMAKARGRRRIGIKMLWEVCRWNLEVRADGVVHDEYKLNNSLTSRYARLIQRQEPDLADMFEIRELRSQ